MEMFKRSLSQSKQLRSLIATAMLIALNLIIDRFSLYITSELKIGFGFITIALTGMLFGPVLGMIAGALSDLLSAILFPAGPLFLGYTFSALIGGLIFGLVLYEKPVNFWRVLLAKGLVSLTSNILLNTLWISITGGRAMMLLLPVRALKNALLLPLEAGLLFLVLLAMTPIMTRMHFLQSSAGHAKPQQSTENKVSL